MDAGHKSEILEKPKEIINEGTLYKFQYGGLLVYDVKAKLLSFEDEIPKIIENTYPPKFSKTNLKDLQKTKTQDYHASLLLKNYPSCPEFPIEYYLKVPADNTTLIFDSKFESGNLSKAIKMSDYDYKLFINNDIGTYCYNHWFYFSVTNPRKTSITFSIINMRKKDVLYKAGMKPAVFSSMSYKKEGLQWQREGFNISYTQNATKENSLKSYTLSFTYSFKFENDLVYFAYAVPYTYEDLNDYISGLTKKYSSFLKSECLCQTLANNTCPLLTITESVSDYLPNSFEKKL